MTIDKSLVVVVCGKCRIPVADVFEVDDSEGRAHPILRTIHRLHDADRMIAVEKGLRSQIGKSNDLGIFVANPRKPEKLDLRDVRFASLDEVSAATIGAWCHKNSHDVVVATNVVRSALTEARGKGEKVTVESTVR